MSVSSIKAQLSKIESSKKRKAEFLLALGAFLLIIVFSWIELKFFGVNSYLFLAVFNLNLILLLLILFLVLRNSVKLFLERRRNVRGSKLRTRLVLAFISLSLIPTILMFLVAVRFVQTSVDYWFQTKLDSSMEQSLQVGRTFYSRSQDRLQRQGEYIVQEIRGMGLLWGASAMDSFLRQKQKEYGLGLIGVLSPGLQEQNWHAGQAWEDRWEEIKSEVSWQGIKEDPEFWSELFSAEDKDLVLGVFPVDQTRSGYLILGATVEQGLLAKLEQIVQGVEEYKQLKTLKNPLKSAFYLLLAVMTMLIIFGSMWFGFRLAKEISAPIQALSLGTRRIADGDLGVRLEDQSGDELGLLVQSFNEMAADLEKSQERLSQANQDLARQNLELEQRRKYMEAVLNNITSGVISLDQEDRISTVNRAALEILSSNSDMLLGRKVTELLPQEYMPLFSEALERLRHSPQTHWQRQLDIQLGDSQRKLLINALSLRSDQGENMGMVMVFEDITELDRMQRMAAWREVARRIAHEIKNPLTPIKLSAQRLERRYSSWVQEEAFSQCTGLIVRQVEHLQQMVQEFSSFAKLPEVSPEQGSLQPLLQEVVGLFQNSHAEIQWNLEMDRDLPEFRFDRLALRRVLINLLTNASEVLKGQPEPWIEVKAELDRESGLVSIQVKDNGPGFSPEEQGRMFEPYFSRKKGNTGLGLTIVKSIVTDHQGYVRVQPNRPRGSIFIVELPA
ncbi:MAG: sensor histidine kinase [Thermodesulfobacteriota bacterium]